MAGVCTIGTFYTEEKIKVEGFDCEVCGRYTLGRDAGFDPLIDPEHIRHSEVTQIQRAALSHRICKATRENKTLTITKDLIAKVKQEGLPDGDVKHTNVVHFIGEEVTSTGLPVPELPFNFHAIIGALDRNSAVEFAVRVYKSGILHATLAVGNNTESIVKIDLSFEAWKQYKSEKKKRVKQKYGFIAMKFDDPILKPFINDVVKPAVSEGTNMELFDLRDLARAGIVENIIQTSIEGATFVIADLTHDNPGAYWESGFAEGVGKPVIYICEEEKFKEVKTHFDTSHRMTVPWDTSKKEAFCKDLIQIIKESIN